MTATFVIPAIGGRGHPLPFHDGMIIALVFTLFLVVIWYWWKSTR